MVSVYMSTQNLLCSQLLSHFIINIEPIYAANINYYHFSLCSHRHNDIATNPATSLTPNCRHN